jgi:hypothetical protein
MIKELRVMRRKGGKQRALANYLSVLQDKGKLTKIVTDKGYLAYDTEEYKIYKATVKRGRPIKEI